jgi:hypothetical protein
MAINACERPVSSLAVYHAWRVIQCCYMSDTSSSDNERLHEGLEVVIVSADEVAEEELFRQAYELFDVSNTNDDDLILRK